MSLLELHNVHTYYGESYVLKGVDLNLERGSVVAVLGRNGVGKTTLIRTIMGLTPARQGTIVYQGTEISALPTYRIARMGIGLVPQGRHLFSSLTTKENMTVAMRSTGSRSGSLEKVVSRFPNLKERLQTRAVRLSGGEQQILAFGRALAGEPTLLLLDEPTEGLAPLLVTEIGNFIREIRQQGISILIVEQSLPFVLKIADVAYIMSKGVIVHQSAPGELDSNAEVKSRYLGV